MRVRDILTGASLRNAMVTHAAFGGSTNLLLHVPAIAHAAGLPRPAARDWAEISRSVPRLVDALPNGPRNHPTVQVFLAGGVPEVMLHLRRAGLLDCSVLTAEGVTLGVQLDKWEASERRTRLGQRLRDLDGVDPDDVILSPEAASSRGLASTMCLPVGNLAPDGAVIKSTAIDPSVVGCRTASTASPGRRRCSSASRRPSRRSRHGRIKSGDVLVLICRGPMGAGMEETYQLTSALKYLRLRQARRAPDRRAVQRRFDGRVYRARLARGARRRADRQAPRRRPRSASSSIAVGWRARSTSLDSQTNAWMQKRARGCFTIAPHDRTLPQIPCCPTTRGCGPRSRTSSGGTWGGCVFDVDRILEVLAAGRRALDPGNSGA